MKARILLIEDDQDMVDLLVDELEDLGYSACFRNEAVEGLAAISEEAPDVVVTDVRMKGSDGVRFCEEATRIHPGLPIIVITAFGTLETAIEALRAGAYDFLTKPFEIEVLAHSLGRAVERQQLRSEVRRLRSLDRSEDLSDGILGASRKITQLRRTLARVALTDVSVLIRGESGTGKELIARAIHRKSKRADRPFVALNCSAIPPDLLESELFGHLEGAFTGARQDRPGLFREAEGGILLLDEIGELPLPLQPKLLRALQERRVRPVGGDQEIPFDIRILSATHSDLEDAIEAGTFRRDLYYRINVVELDVPPLRHRENDILLLAQHFLDEIVSRGGKNVVGFDAEVARLLLAYRWPGNVRELQNCLERAIALTEQDEITAADLPETVRGGSPGFEPGSAGEPLLSLAELERRHIARALFELDGNKTAVARALGVDRKTLRLRMKKYGIDGD